jgi:exodeoxyribonuclease X-like protein
MIVDPPIPHENQFLQPYSVYVDFGKHQGRVVEELILKDPDYVRWILDQPSARGSLAEVAEEAMRLIAIFDSKPFIRPCCGTNCPKQATRGMVYGRIPEPLFWCDDCNPRSKGVLWGTPRPVPAYRIICMLAWGSGHPSERKNLIRNLARAKGLPDRVGVDQAIAFFRQ